MATETHIGDPLDSRELQAELTNAVRELGLGSWLFILRNKLPIALIAESALEHGLDYMHFAEDRAADYIRGLQWRGSRLQDHRRRVTVVIPRNTEKYFPKGRAELLPGPRTPSGARANEVALDRLWSRFVATWEKSGSLRMFQPATIRAASDLACDSFTKLEVLERKRLRLGRRSAITNYLPDVWISFSAELRAKLQMRTTQQAVAGKTLLEMARGLSERTPGAADTLQDRLDSEVLKIIKLSANEFNPRFRGWRIRKCEFAKPLIIHSALCIGRSRVLPLPEPRRRRV